MQHESIDPHALLVHVYDRLIARGLPPTSNEIAEHFEVAPDDALRALGEMKLGKTLLTNPRTGEIWMAGPFSAVPTPYQVSTKGVQWWANCAWDMLGIPVVIKAPVHIEARCTDCGERMRMDVDPLQPSLDVDAVVHFLVPARQWYEDIGFT